MEGDNNTMKRKVCGILTAIILGGVTVNLVGQPAFAEKVDNTQMIVVQKAGQESDENKTVKQYKQESMLRDVKITRQQSVEAALLQVPGIVMKTELECERGQAVYTIGIVDADSVWHKVSVDADSGSIIKVKQEAKKKYYEDKDGEHKKLTAVELAQEARLSPQQGIDIVLQQIQGSVVKIELEEERGEAVYKIEVVDADGYKHKAVVEASSGAILKIK